MVSALVVGLYGLALTLAAPLFVFGALFIDKGVRDVISALVASTIRRLA
jgi:hypothetical protein